MVKTTTKEDKNAENKMKVEIKKWKERKKRKKEKKEVD